MISSLLAVAPSEVQQLIDIDDFITSFCPPGSCMACMGCSSQINDNMITAEMRNSDPAIRDSQYKPSEAPIEISARLYQTWEAAYWTGGKLATPTVVTYSFANDFSGFGAGTIAGAPLAQTGKWQIAPEYLKESVRQAAKHISNATGIELIETADPSNSQITWRMEEFSSDSGLGIIAPPGPLAISGDIIINTKYINQFEMLNNNKGTEGFVWLLHEWGHSLGMKHLFDNNFTLPKIADHRGNTVMSHTLDPTGKVRTGLSDGDINALSYIYGTQAQQEARPVAWAQLKEGGLHSIGSAGMDTIRGIGDRDWISGRAGDDALIGFTGDDTLDGGKGNDLLVGGSGKDAIWVQSFFADRQSHALTLEADPNEAGAFRGIISVPGFGIDKFSGIESFKYIDGTLDLSSGTWTPSPGFELANRALFLVTGAPSALRVAELAVAIETGRGSLLDVLTEMPEVRAAAADPSIALELYQSAITRAYSGLVSGEIIEKCFQKLSVDGTSIENILADLVRSPALAGRMGIETTKSIASEQKIDSVHSESRWHHGTPAVDILSGTPGSDRFSVNVGDLVIGGEGHDVVYLPIRGSADAGWILHFTRSSSDSAGDARGVSGYIDLPGGRISFAEIEEIRFLDRSLNLGMNSLAAQLDRISLGLTGERLTSAEATRFAVAVETGAMRMTDVANELVLDPMFGERFAAPTPANLPTLVDYTFSTLGHSPLSGIARTNWIELLQNFGHSMTGHIAAAGAATPLSKNMWRSEQSDGIWVQRADGGLVARLLEVATGTAALDTEVAQWLFRAHHGGFSAADLAIAILRDVGPRGPSEDAFVQTLFANTYGASPDARMVESIADAIRSGRLELHEIALHLAAEPLWDVVGSTGVGTSRIACWPDPNFDTLVLPGRNRDVAENVWGGVLGGGGKIAFATSPEPYDLDVQRRDGLLLGNNSMADIQYVEFSPIDFIATYADSMISFDGNAYSGFRHLVKGDVWEG
jgi:hypothetical protein